MAEDTVKEALDGVVKAIGFGIVSDFRELYDAVRNISSDIRDGNNILDQVNRNAKGIEKALDDFQSRETRKAQARQFKEAENKLEGRSRINAQRSEESMQRILKAIEELNKNIKLGAAQQPEEDSGGSWMSDIAAGAIGAGAGSFLKGAARVASKAGIVGLGIAGAAAVGAAGAYMMSSGSDESSGSVGPTSGPAGSSSVPTPAGDLAKMGGAAAAVGATAGAAAIIGRSTMSAKQKALAKIAPRVPSYLSKFGGRLATTIGLKSIPIFGALVGGYFSFSRFMSGDSWQAIGAEFASGVAPDIGALAGPAGYVAGVASTLAIQTYLICRDIYQEENAIDIKNNVVPNFDDLDMNEKAQVLNSVKGYVESYINSLIGRSSTSDATTGITPASTSGAAADTTPPAPMTNPPAGGPAGSTPPAADTSGGGYTPPPPSSAATSPPGITTAAAGAIADQRAQTPPGAIPTTAPQQSAYTQSQYGPSASPASAPSASGGQESEQSDGASPSDNMASLSTSSNQAGPVNGDLAITEILETGAGYNVVRLADGSVVKKTGDRNWRNNNPGNIEYGDFTRNHGAIGTDGRFAIFPDLATGRAAKQALLFEGKNYRNKSIAEAIYRWAPPSDNNPTDAYIARAAQGAGVDPSTPLSSLSPEQRAGMMNAMAQVEGMRPGKVTVIQAPQRMAEGGKVTPLTSDTPKAGRDLSAALAPPKSASDVEDEDKMTASQNMIDARRKQPVSGSPKEKNRNTISSYMPYMSFLFGTMTSELSAHVNGEMTADKAFQDAMNPLS